MTASDDLDADSASKISDGFLVIRLINVASSALRSFTDARGGWRRSELPTPGNVADLHRNSYRTGSVPYRKQCVHHSLPSLNK